MTLYIVRRILLVALTLITSGVVDGTTAVVLATQDWILLAADGIARMDDGPRPFCKLFKAGEFFWTVAGIPYVRDKYDVVNISSRTLGKGGKGLPNERVDRFVKETTAALSSALDEIEVEGPIILETLLTWFEDGSAHVTHVQFRRANANVTATVTLLPVNGSSLVFRAIGQAQAIEAHLNSIGNVITPPFPAFLEGLIQRQIALGDGKTGGKVSVLFLKGPSGVGTWQTLGSCP